MNIAAANINQIPEIVAMSLRAFATDTAVGGEEGDCPPEFDSESWHRQMADEGHLFAAMVDEELVGAAILFIDEEKKRMYIGRIFIDSIHHKKGYGMQLMKCIEKEFSGIQEIHLDAPSWNVRTNAFYTKLGYEKTKTEDGFAFYQKKK